MFCKDCAKSSYKKYEMSALVDNSIQTVSTVDYRYR